ncbi:MAG: class II fructose-bisphosphate aldolase [Candidatus Brocadiia bacterium]
MKRPSVAEMMKSACEKRILIPAFNIAYLPMTRPVARTLERLGTFGLAEVAMPDVTRFGAKSFDAVAAEYRKEANPEFVALHLDHVPVIDEEHKRLDWEKLIRKGLDLRFESVMLDGSRLPLEENIAAVRKVVEMCHPKVAVEAELGAVLGHEAGPIPPYEELFRTKRGFTDPDEARRFVKETGVDWLSVAAGSIHGAITGAAKDQAKFSARLHIEHLRALRLAAGVPLVLHGGSGVQKESVLEGIRNGIAKINIGTEIRQAYEKSLAAGKGEQAAQEAVAAKVEELIVEVYGIAGSRAKLCA